MRCRFIFTVIGPRSNAVADLVTQAKMHAEVRTILSTRSSEFIQNCNLPDLKEPRLVVRADDRGIYCMVEPTNEYIACIRFHIVEQAGDQLLLLNDASALRNCCFIFLADTRVNLDRAVIPVLHRNFEQLPRVHYHANNANRGCPAITVPALRTVLVAHEEGAMGGELSASDARRLFGGSSNTLGFANALMTVPLCGGLKIRQRSADFQDADSFFTCLQEIARDMYNINTCQQEAQKVGPRPCCTHCNVQ